MDKVITGIKYLLFLVTIYIYIYNPPIAFLPISPIILLIIIAFVYLILSQKGINLIGSFKIEIVFCLLIFCYALIRDGISGKDVFLKINFFFFLQVIIVPYFIVSFFLKNKSEKFFFNGVFIIGSVAALITLSMILSPDINDLVRNHLQKTDDSTEKFALRTFGFSEGLTFAYGTVQGLIFALVIFFSKYNKWYLLAVPLLLVSILFNARIGFVPVLFSIVYLVVIKFNFKLITVILLFFGAMYFVIFETNTFEDYKTTIEWGFDFFIQSSSFFSGSDNGEPNTLDTLFGEMAVLPKDLGEWLLGSGENVYYANNNSDVGYFIQLNYGGIFYLIILGSFILFMFSRLWFAVTKEYRYLACLFFVTILIINMKGNIITTIPSFRFLMLVYFFFVTRKPHLLLLSKENDQQ